MEGNVHTMSKGPCGPAEATLFMNNETTCGWLVWGNCGGDGEGEKLSH